MPFSFALPTTSNATLACLTSASHPSLPSAATTQRGVLRNTLKAHKRLRVSSTSSSSSSSYPSFSSASASSSTRAAHLRDVQSALEAYIPYLLALDAGLSGRTVAGEEVDVVLERDLRVEWRPTLTRSAVPGREPARARLDGFEYEVLFALHTLAVARYLQARAQLRTLFDSVTPAPEQRTQAIAGAMKSFVGAHEVWTSAAARAAAMAAVQQQQQQQPAADISAQVLQGLASLALAEATLLAVLKDDPWPAAVARERNKNDNEWMIKAPDIPKVRAHLFARLCQAAADHAGRATALLQQGAKVDEAITEYAQDLRRVARAKACRMLGIDREAEAKTGEAIAWLRAARKELGLGGDSAVDASEEKKRSRSGLGFGKLKSEWRERREDKRIEKGTEWGNDAGRFEENRVLNALEQRWTRFNNTVNVQAVPASGPLLATMPSGREYHQPKAWQPPELDEATLTRLRAPPDAPAFGHGFEGGGEADSDDDSPSVAGADGAAPVGAFPGTGQQYY